MEACQIVLVAPCRAHEVVFDDNQDITSQELPLLILNLKKIFYYLIEINGNIQNAHSVKETKSLKNTKMKSVASAYWKEQTCVYEELKYNTVQKLYPLAFGTKK